MIDVRVARRYSQALFDAAKAQDILDAVADDINSVADLLQGDSDFKRFLIDPKTTDAQKESLMNSVFSDRVTALTLQFLRLLLSKKRESELEGIRLQFNRLLLAEKKTTHIVVTTAMEVDGAQREAIITKVAQASGKTVEAEFHVDPKLIGGIQIRYEDYVLEGSVRGSLNRLHDTLIYDLLKQS